MIRAKLKDWSCHFLSRKFSFFSVFIWETIRNDGEHSSWHSSAGSDPSQHTSGPHHGSKVTVDSFYVSCLTGSVAQIRTKTITASNSYTTFSKWDMGKKSTSSRKYVVLPAVPEFWAPCRRLQLLLRAPVIILKCSYPPRHDAATHLCHMMINNAPVRGAVISP